MARWESVVLVAVCCLGFANLLEAVTPGGLACEGCHGVVTELHEKLSKPTKAPVEARVKQLLGKICQLENLVKYVYSPPKMVKACNELLGQHKEAIIDSLTDHFEENPKVTANELEADICFEISKACEGVKSSPEAKVSETVVADQMLDATSGQNIVLEQDGDKIVPKIKEAPKKKDASAGAKDNENRKDSKKYKDKPKSPKDIKNEKLKNREKDEEEKAKYAKESHEKTEL